VTDFTADLSNKSFADKLFCSIKPVCVFRDGSGEKAPHAFNVRTFRFRIAGRPSYSINRLGTDRARRRPLRVGFRRPAMASAKSQRCFSSSPAIRGEFAGPNPAPIQHFRPRWGGVGSLAAGSGPTGPGKPCQGWLLESRSWSAMRCWREAETRARFRNRNPPKFQNQTSRHRRAFGPLPAPGRDPSAASDFSTGGTRPPRAVVRNFPGGPWRMRVARSPATIVSPRLISFCCWMSRPTTSISKARLWL